MRAVPLATNNDLAHRMVTPMAKKNNHNTFFSGGAGGPGAGTPSQIVAGRFGQIACRARKILTGRNRSEIVATADTLTWMLLGDTAQETNFDLLEREAKELNEENGESTHLTLRDAQLLARVVETVSLVDINVAVPILSAPEFFAVLALGLIDVAAEWEQHYLEAGY